MIAEIGLVISIGSPLLLGIIWAVRQEGNSKAHEKLDDERFANVDERHDEIINRLKRIESKFDENIRLNGNGHGYPYKS